jgi:hypothetical protein
MLHSIDAYEANEVLVGCKAIVTLTLHRHKAPQAIAGKRGTSKKTNRRKLLIVESSVSAVCKCPR